MMGSESASDWTEASLRCPVCTYGFAVEGRPPVSLVCGHSICRTCLSHLDVKKCPFHLLVSSEVPLDDLPTNTALALLAGRRVDLLGEARSAESPGRPPRYRDCEDALVQLAKVLRPSTSAASAMPNLSRALQKKLLAMVGSQILEEEGRLRVLQNARSVGERTLVELLLQHQHPHHVTSELWTAVRKRGCQFLGPAMQEEVLRLGLLALENGSALSRKVLVKFVVQRLEEHFPQASKTSVGHVVQLLYRASCFNVTKRDGDSSLMQLKEEFRSYECLRREHDTQIVQIAMETGLKISPEQFSALLYGDTSRKSHMQSIIDKLQTPLSFGKSIQEFAIALQRTGDPSQLSCLKQSFSQLAALDKHSDWDTLYESLKSTISVVKGLIKFTSQNASKKVVPEMNSHNLRYKTIMCRDLVTHNSCPRGKCCTFAHSKEELDLNRNKHQSYKNESSPCTSPTLARSPPLQPHRNSFHLSLALKNAAPIAQVAPLPRSNHLVPNMQTHVGFNTPGNTLNYQALAERAMFQTLRITDPGDHSGSYCIHLDNNPEFKQQSSIPVAKTLDSHDAKALSALKCRMDKIIDCLETLTGQRAMKQGCNEQNMTKLQNIKAPSESSYGSLMGQSGWESQRFRLDDDLIPFSETPQISKFGPISRRTDSPEFDNPQANYCYTASTFESKRNDPISYSSLQPFLQPGPAETGNPCNSQTNHTKFQPCNLNLYQTETHQHILVQGPASNEQQLLASELQLIENLIQGRQLEIRSN